MTTEPVYKLGRIAPTLDVRTFRLEAYLDTTVLMPSKPEWHAKRPVMKWGMYGNDSVGDCTIAALAHQRMVFSAAAGTNKAPSLSSVMGIYYRIGEQENPGETHPDKGLVELDVLKYWRQHSVDVERVLAFAAINPLNHEHVKLAADLFEGLYIGFRIPNAQQLFREFNAGERWTPEHGSDDEGHAVNITDYYGDDRLTCVSWEREQDMGWDFWDAQVDECWAIIPQEFKKFPPAGFDLAHLEADLASLGAVAP